VVNKQTDRQTDIDMNLWGTFSCGAARVTMCLLLKTSWH